MASLELQAYTKLQQIKEQTETQLMQAMAERKLIDVSVSLSAPNILIPKVCSHTHTHTHTHTHSLALSIFVALVLLLR
jgi:hypothetical protein